MAAVNLYDQVAKAAIAEVLLFDQFVIGGSAAVVQLIDQWVDLGGGSTATARLLDQKVTYSSSTFVPGGIAHLSAAGSWDAYRAHTDDGLGNWI